MGAMPINDSSIIERPLEPRNLALKYYYLKIFKICIREPGACTYIHAILFFINLLVKKILSLLGVGEMKIFFKQQ